LVGEKKFGEAESLLLNGYEGLVRTREEKEVMASRIIGRLTPQETAGWIGRMYEEWGKTQQAAEWRRKAQTAQ
jgi:hypothetical protein